ncbi:hypothetical protein CC78DRAFT_531116 [Lojkania enalia]|uniref:Uncharacterized protein n=1 Tax=Lojkania enalia TaxID=147567 RepID=A0A9P4KE61_9PLEO|nr:hypothetical protein CC78DRAFT_531116 [Didymosphaeria enalia]
MECASRGLQFYSYQASQEIIYQEHLARSLTEKYANLSQQMDQLIYDANAQIKTLQDKLQTMHVEQVSLEQKNHELVDAFREKNRTQQQVQKLYQSLKAQVMASHVAHAAGDEADYTLQTARGDRFVDRLPGTRVSTGNLNQLSVGAGQGAGRRHNRSGGSAGGAGGQQRGGIGLGPAWNSQSQGAGFGGRIYTGQSAPPGSTPSQSQHQNRSRLPILCCTRANPQLNSGSGPSYQASSITRQPLGVGSRNIGGLGFGTKTSKRRSGPIADGHLV